MAFKTSELREYLLTDPNVKILIVEGRSDVDFWLDAVPVSERNHCSVYSIDDVDIENESGGNKGAALKLSVLTANWKGSDRIKYFLDADNDNFTGKKHDSNVVLTDCRDMESYALVDDVFERLCHRGANENAKDFVKTVDAVNATVRRVGVVRVTSAINDLDLAFQETFRDGTLPRFFKRDGTSYILRLNSLFDALCPAADYSHKEKMHASSLFIAQEETLTDVPLSKIVHGKDLLAFLAWYFDVSLPIASGMIKLVTLSKISVLKAMPNLGFVENWVRCA